MAEDYVPDEGKRQILQKQQSEVETGNLPKKKEFRIIIVKMMRISNRMEAKKKKVQEMFNKDHEELKNKQMEMNTITEMKKYTRRNQ